jgi:hypothetical protein
MDLVCDVCGLPIEGAEVEVRHWLDDGGEAHADCCPHCTVRVSVNV